MLEELLKNLNQLREIPFKQVEHQTVGVGSGFKNNPRRQVPLVRWHFGGDILGKPFHLFLEVTDPNGGAAMKAELSHGDYPTIRRFTIGSKQEARGMQTFLKGEKKTTRLSDNQIAGFLRFLSDRIARSNQLPQYAVGLTPLDQRKNDLLQQEARLKLLAWLVPRE